MAPRYLLDTDICIYLRRHDRPKITERFEKLDPDEAAISVITYGELAFGVARSVASAAAEGLERFVRTVRVLALPPDAAKFCGGLRSTLASSGRLIGPNDLWIAAHALASDLVLVTNNEREFRRIEGLKIENWAR